LKLRHDELLSSFDDSLRPYTSKVAVARTGPGTFSVNVTMPTVSVPTVPATTGTLTQIAVHVEAGAYTRPLLSST